MLPVLWDWRGRDVTEDLITYRIVTDAAARSNISIPSAELEGRYAARLEDFRRQIRPGQQLEDALRAQGYSRSRLYISIHTELLMDKIAMSAFRPSDFVRIMTAEFRPNPSVLATPLQRAQRSRQRLANGAPWSEVLKDSDLEPSAKAIQGLLGWRTFNAFPAGSRADIRRLKIGEVSKPVTMPGGVVQLFRIDALGTSAKDANALELQTVYLANARPQLLAKLRAAAKIERFAP